MKTKFLKTLFAAVLGLLPASVAMAAEAPVAINAGDTAWMLTSTALVLMMTVPGLALFYGGMVRKKNVITTVAQSLAVCCLMAVLWAVIGYSIAFTNGSNYIGGFERILLDGIQLDNAFYLGKGVTGGFQTTIPESVFMMFQMTFAIITPALIAGAFAERMKFSSTLLFMALWLIVVYAPVAHWVWHPQGFLFAAGVLDFAGGTVVHINAGIAGLVAALMLGRRKGYPGDSAIVGHNMVLTMIGASLLLVGWFGFNAGSALSAGARAGMAMTVTMLSAMAAGVTWMLVEWAMRGKPSLLGICTGVLAGLVGITPAAGFVDPSGGLAIGVLSGIVCYFACTTIKTKLGYDDSLDAFGVHGVAGILGAILTGVFAKGAISAVGGGTAYPGLIDGNSAQVMVQLQGIAATVVWSAIGTAVILLIVKMTVGLRVTEEQERQGLDMALHGEKVD